MKRPTSALPLAMGSSALVERHATPTLANVVTLAPMAFSAPTVSDVGSVSVNLTIAQPTPSGALEACHLAAQRQTVRPIRAIQVRSTALTLRSAANPTGNVSAETDNALVPAHSLAVISTRHALMVPACAPSVAMKMATASPILAATLTAQRAKPVVMVNVRQIYVPASIAPLTNTAKMVSVFSMTAQMWFALRIRNVFKRRTASSAPLPIDPIRPSLSAQIVPTSRTKSRQVMVLSSATPTPGCQGAAQCPPAPSKPPWMKVKRWAVDAT